MLAPIVFYFESKFPHRYLRCCEASENPVDPGRYFLESIIYTTDPVPEISELQMEYPEKRYAIFRDINSNQWYIEEDHREIYGVQEATKYWMAWNLPGDPPKMMSTIGPLPQPSVLDDPLFQADSQLEIRAIKIRKLRNQLLRETDYLVLPDYQWTIKIGDHWVHDKFTEDQLEKIYRYRQQLRDISQVKDFPFMSSIDDRYLPFPPLPFFLTKEDSITELNLAINSKVIESS